MTEQRTPERATNPAGAEVADALATAHATPRTPPADEAGAALVLEHGGSPNELPAVLAQAYRALGPGAPLVVRLSAHTGWSGPVERFRDRLAGIAFAAGFTNTRIVRGTDGVVEIRARRAPGEPPGERRQLLSVVMPVFNERETLDEVIERVLAKEIDGVDIELVIVESNSGDGSREAVLRYAEHPRVRLLLEERPEGKGHAVRAGLAAARGDYVLIQDADLEYDIDDYDALLEPLRQIEAGFVLGYRRRSDGARWGVRHFETQVLVGWLMNIGNMVFLRLFNTVYRAHLRDPFTMYKVFRRDCLTGLRLECNRFDFDWELTGKLLRAGYHPVEVPVRYQSRSFAEGKKVSVIVDPLSWVVACFKYRVAPLYED